MLPFLWVYIGRLGPLIGAVIAGRRKWSTIVACVGAAALALWLVVSTLNVAPHYLAYFNAFAGGPEGG